MKWNEMIDRVPAPLRRAPVILVGVAILVVLLITLSWPKSEANTTAFYEVQRGDLTITVLDRGTLAAVSEVSHRSEVEGTARVIYIVPEGTMVKKGDLLVELDSAQAQDAVNQQEINVQKAEFAKIQAEAQLQIQESAVASDIRAAELKLAFAKLDLDKFDKGQELVELIEATNRVVQLEAQLAVNKETLRWTEALHEKGYETLQKRDGDRLAVMNTMNSLIVSSNTLAMLREFDIVKQRRTYESAVLEATKELERVKAQGQNKINQAKADLITQVNTLDLSKKKLERDRRNLEACKIIAKQDGLVVYAMSDNRFSSESLIEEGAVVRNRQELIKLPDTSRMKVTIKVHESHVGLVRPGQPAFIKLDSMPDQRFQGVVERVAILPDSQARFGNPNLKVYNTEIVITDPLPEVKPGVSAQAEIIVANVSNTLPVPVQAVTTLRGRQVVYAQSGKKSVPVHVQIGMFNTRFIEVTSGLKPGDRILLSPPFDTHEKDLEGSVLAADEKAKVATNAVPVVATASRQAAPALNGNGPVARNGAVEPQVAATDGGAPRPGSPMFTGPGADLPSPGGPGPGGPNRPDFAEMLKQFDKDGDGELDESEREAMRAAMQARFGGQGGPRMSREEMLKRFDKDGDGELNEEERAAMREATGGARGGERGPRQGQGQGREGGRQFGTGPGSEPAGDRPPRSE
jgi:HlyD family secretion protein